jgi:hypothetical protein
MIAFSYQRALMSSCLPEPRTRQTASIRRVRAPELERPHYQPEAGGQLQPVIRLPDGNLTAMPDRAGPNCMLA